MHFSIYESKELMIYMFAVAAAVGAVAGSFLNCVAWRIVRGEPFAKERSKCPHCGHELTPIELIPVISWVLQGGKCRACKAKISARYPLTELGFALVTVLCLARFDLTALCLRNFIFLCCLFLLTLTDLEDMTIPDGCHITAAVTWAVFIPLIHEPASQVMNELAAALIFSTGLLLVSLAMDKILQKESLGGGDIKLFAVVGLYLGIAGTMFTMIFACFAGLAILGLQKLSGRTNTDENGAFPFGPSIALAAAVMLLYGEPLIGWYMGLLGR